MHQLADVFVFCRKRFASGWTVRTGPLGGRWADLNVAVSEPCQKLKRVQFSCCFVCSSLKAQALNVSDAAARPKIRTAIMLRDQARPSDRAVAVQPRGSTSWSGGCHIGGELSFFN